MTLAHRHMSYKFSHKNYRTKSVPMERVCNPEHFYMQLETTHLMVLELLVPKSLFLI